jgi:signal transduction histidine kinase/CheY-like chemotaxis protein
MTNQPTNIVALISRLEGEIMTLWREEALRDVDHAARLHELDDDQLQDHLPALLGKIIAFLQGEPIGNVEEDGRVHGHERRANGYAVEDLLRELQIFRNILLAMTQQMIGTDVTSEEINHGRKLILDLIDRSVNASVAQFTIEAEQERSAAEKEARELHAQRDRFLVTLSHELRNQISPILLAVQVMRELKSADPRIEQGLLRIERQARHQAILINDLLELSRFRFGKLQLKREVIDLRQPLQHALETLRPDLDVKQLKLEIDVPDQSAPAFADKTRITQVVTNLLTNAIKFTPAGGIISIRLAQRQDSILLSVRDTGTGISAEVMQQIFQMFFQGDFSADRVITGLGVGLALAKTLVEMHQGTIEARSEGAGKGAEFVVTLPAAKEVARNADKKLSGKLLLVEDNPDQREALAELLKMRGYQVIEATDGFEALRLVSEHAPDACIIDIGLPTMDGYELARRLRDLPQSRQSQLVAVSGFGMAGDHQAFQDTGFDHYLPKPTNIDELERLLLQDKNSSS